MTTEITTVEITNEIFKAGGADSLIDAVRAEVMSEVPDATTKKGRDRIASLAYKVAKTKAAADKAGKLLADKLNAQLKPINSERKKLRDELDKIKDEVRKPLTEYEQAEAERVANHQRNLGRLSALCAVADDFGVPYDASQLKQNLAEVLTTKTGAEWEEFQQDAENSKAAIIPHLEKAIAEAEKREVEAAELEKLRQEAAERERVEYERRIAEQAAEQAKAEAERIHKEQIERAEREAKEAAERERKMKAAAEQAEIDRIAAEEKAKADAIQAAEDARLREIARQNAERERVAAEEAARMADVEHRRAINAAALQALVKSGLDEQSAKLAVMAIVAGNIPGVSIKY